MGWPKHNRHKTLAAGALIGASIYTGKAQPVAEFNTDNRFMRRMKKEKKRTFRKVNGPNENGGSHGN